MSNKSWVSLEQKLCLICGKAFDTKCLLLNRSMRETLEHATITGNGICPDDQKKIDDGYIALIAIDPDKSTPGPVAHRMKPEDAYRTGEIGYVRREVYQHLFNVPLRPDQPFTFCDAEVLRLIEARYKEQFPEEDNQDG